MIAALKHNQQERAIKLDFLTFKRQTKKQTHSQFVFVVFFSIEFGFAAFPLNKAKLMNKIRKK